MIVVMEESATDEQISNVVEKLLGMGFDIYRITGALHTVLGAVGDKKADLRYIELLSGVKKVVQISSPYKLAGRGAHTENTIIKIKNVEIGGKDIVMMAGPSAIESRDQINAILETASTANIRIVHGDVYKMWSSRSSFRGLGEEGLKILRETADRFNMAVVSGVTEPSQIETLVRYADILQVSESNMQNFNLLSELGKIEKPVILKRRPESAIDELLVSAEALMAGGNRNVILCESGRPALEASSRTGFDILAIPEIKRLSHLPVVVDASQAAGRRDLVMPMARAAVAAGADGLLLDIHNAPDIAFYDGPQSLFPEEFKTLVEELRIVAGAIGRKID